ncbi:MAG: thermonuclease family protein [Candidatus Omnitrophica bacterium]|nr:thermonuclease family protein [Candidatus Omnitrophota bacterium]
MLRQTISRVVLIVLFFFLSFLVGCQPCPFQKQINAKVAEVIDGDTIELADGRLVRYIGIDTPELSERIGEDWIEKNEPFAQSAKLLNEELVKAKTVRLEFDRERTDKYGRLLAYCFVDNTFVNEIILEQGFALLYLIAPNIKYSEILVAAQGKARDNNRGLWQEELFLRAEEAHRFIGNIATVEGEVLDVVKSRKVIYLNFDRDYRTDFTVVIFQGDLSTFLAAGISPERYKGRVIRVFGKIKEYNGPEIVVGHPSQIEIIR